MIRTIAMLTFWGMAAPVAALIGFPWTFISGDISLLYSMFMWGAWNGVRLTGVRVETVGLDQLDAAGTYIFMSNHVSNLDPPILIPLIPRRTSVMVKKELFTYPILGRAMRMGSLVPVDRGNRDATLIRRQATALQERTFLLGDGVRCSRCPGHDRGHALRHAKKEICDQAGDGEGDLP